MSEIYVEVRPGLSGGDLSTPPRPEKLLDRIDEIGECLKKISERLSERLDELSAANQSHWHLGEVAVKFSIDLEAEAGLIVARTKAAAGLEASMTWKKT